MIDKKEKANRETVAKIVAPLIANMVELTCIVYLRKGDEVNISIRVIDEFGDTVPQWSDTYSFEGFVRDMVIWAKESAEALLQLDLSREAQNEE